MDLLKIEHTIDQHSVHSSRNASPRHSTFQSASKSRHASFKESRPASQEHATVEDQQKNKNQFESVLLTKLG